ncbi:MAG TPA: TraR/DksA family transcriptional regulator [Candidatus Binatia bacterium]|nr:TraR/DksA family transcriptional regulator [Candidatus Binatia bacterium]
MNAIRTGKFFERLTKRRLQLVTTLEYLGKQQKQVEENTDWLDQAAYESRVRLLDRLTEWSVAELSEIDRALDRIKARTYGLCLACHRPIESERLDAAPEAEYCKACQEVREALQRPQPEAPRSATLRR